VPPPGSTPYPPNSAYYEVPAGTPGASYNSTLGVYYLINPTVDMGNLTFKNGVSLNSLYTYVPPGTSPSTPLSVLEAGLAQNAGHYNLTLPDTNNSNGLRNPLGVSTQVRSISGTLRRQMTGVLELFATLSTASNHSFENTNAFGLGTAQLSPGNPYNPFLNYITIIYPSELSTPAYSNSTTHSFTFGGTLKLPKDWRAEFDYTWSQSLFEEISWSGRGGPNYEIAPSDPQVYDGPLDFMMDTAKYLDLTGYALPIFATGSSTSNDLALRASGPLYHFPWGAPVLSFSLDHNKYGTPVEHNPYVRVNPTFPDGNPVSGFNANGSTTLNNHDAVEFGQSSTDDSAYAELNVPIFKTRYPFLRALNMQVALRFDQTKTGAGTQGYYYNAVNPSLSSYFGTTSDGGTSLTTSSPYRYIITTRSTNFTGPAWEYEPFDTVKIRFSYASAFLPPTPGQLLPSPKTGSYVNTTSNYVADPKHPTAQTGTHTSNGLPAYLVAVYSMGGNPDLSPQSSKSWDVGAIWEPRRGFVKGLRADVEFSETVQHNAISGQSAQFFVDNEALYPNNVIRDPTTGLITEVDTENVNLFAYKEDRWDLSLSYRRPTSWGTLGLFAMETINEHEQQQVSFSTPRSEFVGTDGGPLKTKFNGTLSWSLRGLTLSCTGTYYDKYAATTRAINTLTPSQITSILNAQGAFYVQSQTYYDLFASYTIPNVRFGSSRLLARLSAYALSNMTIQLGVHNVFNTFPAYDSNNGPFYYSYYGDIRLRNYWLTLKKAF
jgi:outer membrane receptor protein involved in Fe transport